MFNNEKIHHSYKFDFNEKLTTLFSEEENPNYDILTSIYFWMQNQEDIYVRTYFRMYCWNYENYNFNFRKIQFIDS